MCGSLSLMEKKRGLQCHSDYFAKQTLNQHTNHKADAHDRRAIWISLKQCSVQTTLCGLAAFIHSCLPCGKFKERNRLLHTWNSQVLTSSYTTDLRAELRLTPVWFYRPIADLGSPLVFTAPKIRRFLDLACRQRESRPKQGTMTFRLPGR